MEKTNNTRELFEKAFFSSGSININYPKLEEKKEDVIPSPKKVKKYLDKYVVGQEYAKKVVSTLLVNHMHRSKYNSSLDKHTQILKKSNMLLIGDSGVGKTLIIKVAAEFIDVPVIIEDATKLTQEGYVGDSVDTILTSLFVEAGKDLEKAERGVIFLDEFDKLGCSGATRGEVSTGAVQQSLLKMVEGGTFYVKTVPGERDSKKVKMDTTNITFIFAGAFEGLAGEVGSGGSISLGFKKSTRERKIVESDIIKFGIMPEILGRIGTYVTLHELSGSDMFKVLTEIENSLIHQYKKLFEIRGLKWKLKKKDYLNIIKEVKETKLGARGLQHKLEQLLLEDLYNG